MKKVVAMMLVLVLLAATLVACAKSAASQWLERIQWVL